MPCRAARAPAASAAAAGPDDDELVDAAGDDLGTDLGVQGVGLVAELEHGAEHGPGAPALPHPLQGA